MSRALVPPPFRFGRHPLVQALDDSGAFVTVPDPSRRDFLRGGFAAGLALGLPPLLASCSGSDAEPAPPMAHEKLTLFFNLSHFDHAGRTHFIVGGNQRHELVAVAAKPEVLAAARQGNAFLREVPDASITHHVEGVVLATDSVTICYQGTVLDVAAGTWSMTGVFYNIPSEAAKGAYLHARQRTPGGPLPRSAKRVLYGLSAAESPADLAEERVLVDVASYAAAMVGAHPDLMSIEPGSAHIVHSSYIDTDINTILLTEQLSDPAYGPAMPAITVGQKNPTGWGTLAYVTDQHGAPLRNTLGKSVGQILYQPAFHPDITGSVASASSGIVPAIKDDPALGRDVTGRKLDSGASPDPMVAGALWFRHDGIANILSTSGLGDVPTVSMALKNATPGAWLWPSATSSVNGDGSVQVELNMLNWGLRFLGIYLQFLTTKTDPPSAIKLTDIPEYNNNNIVSGHDKQGDTEHEMFLGMLGPVFTVLGIPTWPGFIVPSLRMPSGVDRVRVLSGGLAFTGSNTYPTTVVNGAVMTGVFNYGMTALMAALGAGATFSQLIKDVVIPYGRALALELSALISAELKHEQDLVDLLLSPSFWESQGLILAKLLVTKAQGVAMTKFVEWAVTDLTEAAMQDSVPVAGWVMLGISLTVGALNLAETSVELALSPWTFVDELSFTHDLTVELSRDPQDSTFPAGADHYTVTALFDDGTPHMQTLAMPGPAPATLPPVVFHGVPLGGQVNVSVAFHQAGTATSVAVLLGKGSTGLVPNTANDAVPPLVIQELKFPIDANTTYVHKQKTEIDPSGVHVWKTAPAPTANASNTSCGGAGTVCPGNAITVRQGTSQPVSPGYVGYAWRGQSSDPSIGKACKGGGTGLLDVVANLNTADASLGYATTPCGLDPGVQVAYNLLSHGSANFYLDTSDLTAPVLRQVTLGSTPSIDSPRSGKAWGVLNFASDALLLHPAGHVISLNALGHKLETHRLPAAPLADDDAKLQLRAQVHGGQGTRAGLLTTPQHAAVAPDGTVLVLEAGDASRGKPSRLQAFNLSANPVRFFSRQAESYFFILTDTPNDQNWLYLDLAVEFSGFIYVLSYNANSFVYRLDIYHPSQTGTKPISTTTNFNAAKIAIDFWRNVYALNYEVLVRPTPGLAEPSVSLWVPSSSCTGVNCTPS